MDPGAKTPVAFTFGNHMHWVDMEWLWGYDVLPGSVRDMLRLCEETGAKGCVNFDAVGYEKMAAECPEVLQQLRQAVQSGQIEIVGASYGQPYGLFHGAESNIRQRIYGLRTCIRLFGVRPTTFWEEELDFFPQLPQVLKKCGFSAASLFFQWTWHTPEIPREESPAIRWRGCDGSEIIAATRNAHNLHQWPEDFEILLENLSELSTDAEIVPLIQQWVELMPSQDWMCRSEVLLPVLQRFLNDPRFEVHKVTLGEYIRGLDATTLPQREYPLGEIWHGMTLGKSGDHMRRTSRTIERILTSREAIASVLGLFARPYPRWDVYPTWEFEESWRNLMVGQHHDNCECEGLCGDIGFAYYDQATSFDVHKRLELTYADRVTGTTADVVLMNPLGWPVRDRCYGNIEIPAYGHVAVRASDRTFADSSKSTSRKWLWQCDEGSLELTTAPAPTSTDEPKSVKLDPYLMVGEERLPLEQSEPLRGSASDSGFTASLELRQRPHDNQLHVNVAVATPPNAIAPGYGGAVRLCWDIPIENAQFIADTAYAISVVEPTMKGQRKYPKGDWMVSEQWFEEVSDGLYSASFLDVIEPSTGAGFLIHHDSGTQWFVRHGRLEAVAFTVDAWDNHPSRAELRGEKKFTVIPHGRWSNIDRYRMTKEIETEPIRIPKKSIDGDIPREFSAVQLEAKGSAITSLYREQSSFAGKGLEKYAGKGIEHPYILRLVEFNGEPDRVTLRVWGQVAAAFRTTLMGEVESSIQFLRDNDGFSVAELDLAPREIVTIYADLVEGRKQVRDLDAKREIWATIHRHDP